MFKLVKFLLLISTIVFISCDILLDNDTDNVPPGAYLYTASDTSGTVIVEGWFTMEYQNSTEINGEWHFQKIGNPQNIGPQVGDGDLLGTKDSSRVQINLNPQYKDNNVFLLGEIEGHQYIGEWHWITIIGPTNKGDFEAIQN